MDLTECESLNNALSFLQVYGDEFVSYHSDLDYEYATATDGQNFADLLTELRTAFDALATKKGDSTPYQLSVSRPSSYRSSSIER